MSDEYVVFFLISKSFIMVLIKCLLIENQQLVKIKIYLFFMVLIFIMLQILILKIIYFNCFLNI